MLLDNNKRKLQAVLSLDSATADMIVTIQYRDDIREKNIIALVFANTDGTTLQTLLETPDEFTARHILEIHIYNSDSITQQLIISIWDNGVARIVRTAILNSGDTLYYNEHVGWKILPADGTNSEGIYKNFRTTTVNTSITLLDDIIEVDATAGAITIVCDPGIVTIPGKVKEVKIIKIDPTTNRVNISDGTTIVVYLDLPGAYEIVSDGSTLKVT